MITIIIENNYTCSIDGDPKEMRHLYQRMRLRHPNSFYMKLNSKNRFWDGFVDYIRKAGYFSNGLLELVIKIMKEDEIEYTILDGRKDVNKIKPEIPTQLGEYKLRPEQIKAIETLVTHEVEGYPFQICVGDYNVGFGKSLVFCGIYKAFKGKLKTVLLLNDADLFNQFKTELPKYLPDEDISFIQGGKADTWTNFNVCMVQSLARNIKFYEELLLQVDMVLIDECDVIDNKTYKEVIKSISGAPIRIGLSGTIYMSKNQKDMIKNLNIMSFIGSKVERVSLEDQTKAGNLTPLKIKMVYAKYPTIQASSYEEEVRNNVIDSKYYYLSSLKRAKHHILKEHLPMIIVVHYIEQSETMYRVYKKFLGDKYKIEYINHNIKNRKEILDRFRNGDIDILITTLIISRGKNLPLAKYLQNSASMDSETRAIQILGRLVRKHESKKMGFLDDIVYPGKYLERHGKHRSKRYEKEGYIVSKKELLIHK